MSRPLCDAQGTAVSITDSDESAAWTNRRASARAKRAANARQESGRRRFVDPTTCERDYTDAETEFMMAMNEYKRRQRADVSDLERGARGSPGARVRKDAAGGPSENRPTSRRAALTSPRNSGSPFRASAIVLLAPRGRYSNWRRGRGRRKHRDHADAPARQRHVELIDGSSAI